MSRKPSKKAKSSSSRQAKQPGVRWGILIVLGIAIIAYIYSSILKSRPSVGPQFTKEGELTIKRENADLAVLDIEFAESTEDITQGLMYREKMAEDQGMLFLMPDTAIQSFWMSNTLISLDIIFVDANRRIINVAANTIPKSIDPVSSTAPAAFVLEVNSGYAERKELRAGDELVWVRN